jgi:hypothetical protein
MRRILFLFTSGFAGWGALAGAACSSAVVTSQEPSPADAGSAFRRDGGFVVAPEAGAYDGAVAPQAASCAGYCNLVMSSCTGQFAQFASSSECMATCTRLPTGRPDDVSSNSVACRNYYAGTPAQTDPAAYCPTAGPFGGGVCGDPCSAFCSLAINSCANPRTPQPWAYSSYAECQTACATYPFRAPLADAEASAPEGDTLNCRLSLVRAAVADAAACSEIGVDSGTCR